MGFRLLVGCVLFTSLTACPSDPRECYTTQDCFDQERTLTACVNGQCLRQCVQDEDCQYLSSACADEDQSCKDQVKKLQSEQSICENFLCVSACPDLACAANEQCVQGRCTFFYESFEADKSGDVVNLQSLGWNAIDWPLANPHLRVAWSGGAVCVDGSDRDRCAGSASDGEYFALIQRNQSTARAERKLGTTCRDCACCLACRDPFSRTSTTSVCPGLVYPQINECSETIHPQCQTVCDSCSACPDEAEGVVTASNLNACELQTAAHACEACLVYNQCLKVKEDENRPCPGDAVSYPECAGEDMSAWTQADCTRCLVKECASLEDDCHNCRQAATLKAAHPDEPERWRDIEARCIARGALACLESPKSTTRSDLSDDEQALASPEIDLSQVKGDTVLQFDFVAFDLQNSFIRVIQGSEESTWPTEQQQVRVQICKSDCNQSASWSDAKFASSASLATIPASIERMNGLLYTQQVPTDWKLSTRSVRIPKEMTSKTFRFRFVPYLERDALLAVDNIWVKDVSQ